MTDIASGPANDQTFPKWTRTASSPNRSSFNNVAPQMPRAQSGDVERTGHLIARVKPGSPLEDAIYQAMIAKAALTPKGLRA